MKSPYLIRAWEMREDGYRKTYWVYNGDPHCDVESATCEKKWDEAGRLTFTIYPNNSSYELFTKTNKIMVQVELRNNYVYWRGFVSRIEIDLTGRKKITCIGCMDFLKDAYRLSYGNYQAAFGNAEYLINQMLIEYNNLQIHPDKKIDLNVYPNSFRNNNIKFKLEENEYLTYFDLASTRAHEYEESCHLTMTHEGWQNNLNFIYSTQSYPTKDNVPIKTLTERDFISASKTIGDTDVFSAVLPYAKIPETGDLYIAKHNEYFSMNEAGETEYVTNASLLDEYGLIIEAIDYTDLIENDSSYADQWRIANYNGSSDARKKELCAKALKDISTKDLKRRKTYIDNAKNCLKATIIDDLLMGVEEFNGLSTQESNVQLFSDDIDIDIDIDDDIDIDYGDEDEPDIPEVDGDIEFEDVEFINPDADNITIYQPGVLVKVDLPKMGISNLTLPIVSTKVNFSRPYELEIELGDAYLKKIQKASGYSATVKK